ncbi:unnamed protein product [Larinioides sclopetarius]|uniref:Uncharacterized protein n=1 Tax=Larinioides sclopetarius TaxID=280406 RepID=A0AAV2B1L6_9ARAC
MNQNMMQSGGMQCLTGCPKAKKQITLIYDFNLNKFPIRFKLFG